MYIYLCICIIYIHTTHMCVCLCMHKDGHQLQALYPVDKTNSRWKMFEKQCVCPELVETFSLNNTV